MKKIVLDIYRGSFEALERFYSRDSGHAYEEMEKLTELMKRKIPSEFHDLLQKYEDAMMKLVDAASEEDFLAGYQLGVRMLIAAWPETSDKDPL